VQNTASSAAVCRASAPVKAPRWYTSVTNGSASASSPAPASTPSDSTARRVVPSTRSSSSPRPAAQRFARAGCAAAATACPITATGACASRRAYESSAIVPTPIAPPNQRTYHSSTVSSVKPATTGIASHR
jgi:hypothetical protein